MMLGALCQILTRILTRVLFFFRPTVPAVSLEAHCIRRSAEAYTHPDFIEIKIFLEIYPKVGSTLPDPDQGSFLLPPDCSDAELGSTLQKGIAAYRVIPTELSAEMHQRFRNEDWHGQWIAERMAQFGYKRKGQLFKRLHLCFIEEMDGIITISPSWHDRPDGWTVVDTSNDIHIPMDSPPEAIGAALRLGFSRCWGR